MCLSGTFLFVIVQTIIKWLDEVSFDYLYVETQLSGLRLAKKNESQASAGAGQSQWISTSYGGAMVSA